MAPTWFNQLAKPTRDLLLGAAGDYLGGLAGAATGKIIQFAGYGVIKRFQTEPRRKALNLAMAQALHETIDALADNREAYEHFLGILKEWIDRDDVSAEFSQMIAPHPDAEFDVNLLHREFEALGYSSEMLGEGVNFMKLLMNLVKAFSNAAARQPELQDQIKIGYLKDIADRMTIQVQENIQQTRDIKRLADQLVPDMTPRKRSYLSRVANQCDFLSLKGMDFQTADASTNADARMKLADVYVALDTTTRIEEEKAGRPGRQLLLFGGRALSTLEAVASSRRMVLLGDPGGGKSTFVNHLSLCLAGHILNPHRGWLDRLPKWPGVMSNLLPIPVALRNLAAWARSAGGDQTKSKLLLDYLQYWLGERALGDCFPLLENGLQKGKAILLLDGLDEVPADDALRARIKECIADLPIAFENTSILLTCRVLSYQDPAWRMDGNAWPVFELDELNEEKIDHFILAWHRQLADMNVISNPDASSGKLSRAVRRPDLWRLACNPLLLTVMAVVHTHKGEMPDARALLYEDVVDLLLWRWEAVKLENEDEKETTWRKLLQKANLNDIDLKRALWMLAYAIHGQTSDSAGADVAADIPEAALLGVFRELHPDRSLDWADQLVKIMKLRAGLLLEGEPGVYSFPHRTFQEYLAGCHLTTLDFTSRSLELVEKGAFWREVILLAVARLVHLHGDIDKPLVFVSELCPREKPKLAYEQGWRNTWLAGQCLLEIGLKRAERRDIGPDLAQRVRNRLTQLITRGLLEPRERAEAGTVLSVLGDPRDLDEMVNVPAGKFLMGSIEKERKFEIEKESPQHTVAVEAYRIGKYPVTNGQYLFFVNATGHRPPKHWKGSTPPPEILNHPVTLVSWNDARNYCQWLSMERGDLLRLPTEAEWEKAARGEKGCVFPWGDLFESDRCNTEEFRNSLTNSVGIFANAAGPYECMDMAGNVWEWTQTKPIEYPYYADDGREDIVESDDSVRVIRGGSFRYHCDLARCAFRNWDSPDARYFDIGFRVVSPGLCSLTSEKL